MNAGGGKGEDRVPRKRSCEYLIAGSGGHHSGDAPLDDGVEDAEG